MLKKLFVLSSIVGTLLSSGVMADESGDGILRIVGSSTVFPFSSMVADQYVKKTGKKSPVVESTGTGGGMKAFCTDKNIAIVNASRTMKKSEVELCEKNNVDDIVEVLIGYDAIVMADSGGFINNLKLEWIKKALSKKVMIRGKLVNNPYLFWSDIDISLPAKPIKVIGPGPTSGTYDSFLEMSGIEGGIREDGVYMMAGENDNVIVKKLGSDTGLVGIFGFSYFDENRSSLDAINIEGVNVDADDGYVFKRELFFYYKESMAVRGSNLVEYRDEFLSEDAIGENGYLLDKGLIVD